MTSSASTSRVEGLFEGLKQGHRASLGQALTLVESRHAADIEDAALLLDACLPLCSQARSVAITGVPGAGKSSLVDELGMRLIALGHHVAVLAVDPSSLRTGGSVLGDKTRMEHLSRSDHAFVRPSPTSGTLGGVAAHTRRSMILCAAAGYDRILIETVGVGQNEVTVASMVQCVVLVLLAGAGDALQGIKRGILEIPDIVVFNKSDVAEATAHTAAIERIKDAMNVMKPDVDVPVFGTSAKNGRGIDRLVLETDRHLDQSHQPFMPSTRVLFRESVEQLISHGLNQEHGPFRRLLGIADHRLEERAGDGPWRAATWFYNELDTLLSITPEP